MHIVLGSQSPRRKEILSFFNLPFEAVNSNFDEESIAFQGNPAEYAKLLSEGKALALQEKYFSCPILTADTIVYYQGQVFGKPQDKQAAFATLKTLSGKWHSVYTGVTLLYNKALYSKAEETRVLFNPLDESLIAKYCDKLHLYDKAGSYQIQGAGGLIVRKIDGCYYNVLGLPINTVKDLLQNIAIDLWDYLK